MIKIFTTFCLALILLSSCDPKKTSENASLTEVDSVVAESTLPHDHIKGKGGYLYVDDGGEGNIPVLFVHSFGGSTEHWRNQLEHLRKDRRAIAFDLSGHGKSDTTVTEYEIETFSDDIAAVADSLKLDRFILVGHSLGGAASIKYSGDHPERVAGLLLVGTPGKSSPEQSKPIITSLHSDKYQEVMDNYMKQLLTDAKPAVNSLVTENFNRISKPVSIEIIESIFAFDPTPSLNKYAGPKMIVSAPRESKQPGSLHKILPDVPYKSVEGTSHWIQLDKPDEFNKILDEFVKGIK
jgi:pimeloyl-ACP methyl ester carboxylesterase